MDNRSEVGRIVVDGKVTLVTKDNLALIKSEVGREVTVAFVRGEGNKEVVTPGDMFPVAKVTHEFAEGLNRRDIIKLLVGTPYERRAITIFSTDNSKGVSLGNDT